MTNTSEAPDRAQWLRLWSALPAAAVKALAADLAGQHRVEDLALPQSGLGLLPLTDSALGDTYFIGEIPLAQAHVRVTTTQGQSIEGAAILVDDRAGVARSMARGPVCLSSQHHRQSCASQCCWPGSAHNRAG